MATRIFIADDDDTIRYLLRRVLTENPDWEVCGEAKTGMDAVHAIRQLDPDLVILDLAMPNMNGMEAARQISEDQPEIRMLLLTVQEVSSELAKEAAKVGFKGAISKRSGEEAIRGIEALLREETFFPIAS